MNLVDLFFFVECHVHDHAAAENLVPIATAVTNTGTQLSCIEGPLYPFGKVNHVKILGLFTRHV